MPCVDEVLPVVDSTSIDESVSSLDAHLLMLFVYSCSYTTKGEKQEANGDDTRYYPANVSKSRRNLPTIEFGSIDTTSSQHQQRRANITSPGVIHSSIGLLLWRRRIRLCCCHTTHSVNCRWWHTHTSNSAQRYRNEEKEEREFWLLLHSHHTSVQSQGEIKAKDPSLLVFILHIHLDVHRFIAPLTKHQRHKLSSQRATAILRFLENASPNQNLFRHSYI